MKMQWIVLVLISTSLVCTAQDKKKSKKEKKEDQEIVVEEVIFEEPVPEIREIRLDVEAAPTREPRRDGTEPYFLQESVVAKDVSIVYQGSGYGNQRYALYTYQSQKKLTPFIFESINNNFSRYDQASVTLYGKTGVINTKGEVIVPIIYEGFSSFEIDNQLFYIGSKGGLYGVINSQNDVIIPFMYEHLSRGRSSSLLLTVKQFGKYGLLNLASKQIVLPIEFEELSTYGDYITAKKDGLYNYYGDDGQPLFTTWYESLRKVDEDQIIVRLAGKEGTINLAGKTTIPLQYQRLEYFYGLGGTYFTATKDGKEGILKGDGSVAIPLIYDRMQSYQRDQLIVSKGALKGIIAVDGQTILPIEYDIIEKTNRSLIVKKKGEYSLIDRSNQPILSSFSNIQSQYIDGSTYLLASKNNKLGIYDESGRVVIAPEYDQFLPTSTSSYGGSNYKFPMVAKKDGKLGMVDKGNKILLPFEYDELVTINSFLVGAKKNSMYGVFEIYNPKAIALPFEYDFLIYKEGKLVGYKSGFKNFAVQGTKVIAND
jgi:hypothetical protein